MSAISCSTYLRSSWWWPFRSTTCAQSCGSLSLGHDVKLVSIYERLGLTEDEVKAAADRSLERVGADARAGLDADWRIATSGR
jgi:hypothetical protein